MAKFGINDIMDIKSKTSGTDGANEYKEIWLNPYEVKPLTVIFMPRKI